MNNQATNVVILAKEGLSQSMNRWLLPLMMIIVATGCRESEKQAPLQAGNIAAIDSLIQHHIEQDHIPGAVIQVKRKDSIWHRKAYGDVQKYDKDLQRLDDPEKMTTDHLFDLASLTKVSATTFGFLLLADRHSLPVDGAVCQWLPEFEPPEKKDITVRHLLTHSAGLYQWKPTYYFADNSKEQYRYIANLPLRWEVGAGRHYSDLGFMLLGEIIERISGQSLDTFLEEELYNPLNLEHTAFNPLELGYDQIAATSHGNPFEKHMVYDDDFGYAVDVDPESWQGWRHYVLRGEVSDGNAWYGGEGVAGHGGLVSTVDDLQVLVDLLLSAGQFEGEQLISPSIVDTFLSSDQYDNGLGWAMDPEVIAAEGTPAGTFGHTGFTGTNIVAVPEYDLSIILLTNREQVGVQPSGYYYDMQPMRQQVVDLVLERIR